MAMKLKAILAVILSGMLVTDKASAMPILYFAKMKNPDRATYIDNMVEGVAKILKDQGHPDQAQQVIDLFGNATKDGGVNRFVMNLKECDLTNRHNAINPNNRKTVLQVEDAMAKTLKDIGIIVPVKELLAINEHFMPAAPKIQMSSQ